MSDNKKQPAQAVAHDEDADKAPDPRRHYASPEDLREDGLLTLDEREHLLQQWRLDLDRRIESESEGMSASDPMSTEQESRLANEARRVNAALEEITRDRLGAEALRQT